MGKMMISVLGTFGTLRLPNVRLTAGVPELSDIYDISKDVPAGIYVVSALIAAVIILTVVCLRRKK